MKPIDLKLTTSHTNLLGELQERRSKKAAQERSMSPEQLDKLRRTDPWYFADRLAYEILSAVNGGRSVSMEYIGKAIIARPDPGMNNLKEHALVEVGKRVLKALYSNNPAREFDKVRRAVG